MKINISFSQIRSYFSLIVGIVLYLSLVFLSSCQTTLPKDHNVIHLTLWQSINPPVNRDVFERLVEKI